MKQCKYCQKRLSESTSSHYCESKGRTLDDSDDFLISLVIGAATDSALLGGIIGGDIVGGIVGDLLDGDLFD